MLYVHPVMSLFDESGNKETKYKLMNALLDLLKIKISEVDGWVAGWLGTINTGHRRRSSTNYVRRVLAGRQGISWRH